MNTETINPTMTRSKHHFEILDGLRGVAAIAIVIFHFMEIAYTPDKNFIGHGFLAVDFFFCLSGFVIGYAYDDRIGKMGLIAFFKTRFIRLHPLVLLGSVLGLLAFLFDPFTAAGTAGYGVGKIILIFLSSALLIPYPVMEGRFFNLFGLNAPSWSLFWEYMASIVYAFVLYRSGRRTLVLLTALSAALLVWVAYDAGSLLGGWAGENFWDGGARIAYSFLAGLLIFRYNLIIKNKLGFIGLSVLLLLAFLMPFSWSWKGELMVVMLYFPLLIMLGAGAQVATQVKKLCTFSGNISYPLYMTHYMVMWMFGSYYAKNHPGTGMLTIIIIVGTSLLIGFAYAAMVLYDIPVRKYLSNRRREIKRPAQ
jgi:peptidoglycan/LPS O-acetylase OafA/YrhL